MEEPIFYRGNKVRLAKFSRKHNVYGWISTVYFGVIADMGDIDDNKPTPNTSELDPASIRLNDGSLINFGNKYELRLI